MQNDTRNSDSSGSRDCVAWLAPLSLGLVGFALAFYPTLGSGFEQLQIRPGDPRLVNYLFEHSYRWLAGWPLHAGLWSPPVFYPAEGVGAYTDTVLGAAPFYWVWRFVGFAPDLSFQFWMMVCLSLNFATAYAFLSRVLGLAPWPAAVGALLFGFGSVRLANFNSGQLFVVFYGMLALLALVRVFQTARDEPSSGAVTRWMSVFSAFLVLQIWSSWYPSFFLLLGLLAAALGALCFADTRAALLDLVRRHPVAIASAGVLGLVAIAPMLSAHLGAAAELGWRDEGKVARGLPTWASWFYMGSDHWLYGGLSRFELFSFRTPPSQHSNGVGFVTGAVAVLGLLRARAQPIARILLVATVLVVLVSTTLCGGFSLWPGVQAVVPGAGSIRFVARIGMLLAIPASIGVALFLDRCRGRAVVLAIATAIGVICVLEQAHVLVADDTQSYNRRVSELASELDIECEAFLLSVVHPAENSPGVWRRFKLAQVAAMWVALEAGIPTVNGNLGSAPPDYPLRKVDVQRAGLPELEAGLLDWSRRRGIDADAICQLHVLSARMPAAALRTESDDAGES